MSMLRFDHIKHFVTRIIIITSVIIAYVTITLTSIYSQFIPLQAPLMQSHVQTSIDTISSKHYVGEIQQTPSGISFRWVDSRVPIQIPKFLYFGSIVSFTTWLYPVANTISKAPYDIVSIDEKIFTTQSDVFVPRTYRVLSLPTIYSGSDSSLFVPYVFTSDTPYWAYSGVTVEKIDVISFGIAYAWLFVLLILIIPPASSGICWYVTRRLLFSLGIGLLVAFVLAGRVQILYSEYIAMIFNGTASQHMLIAIIVALTAALLITLYRRPSPFWHQIKHILRSDF